MKKLILIILTLIPLVSLAQTDTARVKPRVEYCMLVVEPNSFNRKVNISVDRGAAFKAGKVSIKEDSDIMGTGSIVDALNYMAARGWIYLNEVKSFEASKQNLLLRRELN
jgi:hypothetical protein